MNKNKLIQMFEFLETIKGEKFPFIVKLILFPEQLTTEELTVKGGLYLAHQGIQSLPNNLHVNRDLDLEHSDILSLPDNLFVGRDLYIDSTKIDSLPRNLRVGRNLFFSYTPLSQKYYADQIRQMIEDRGGSVGGYISK